MSDNPAVWAKLFESMATANASFIDAYTQPGRAVRISLVSDF